MQALKPDDCSRRAAYAEEMFQRIDDDNNCYKCVIFSDKASFYVSGRVNKHNVRIWGSQNCYEAVQK